MSLHITILYLFCTLFNGLISGLTLKKNPYSTIHKYFFLFGVSTILWMATLYWGYYYIEPFDPQKSLWFIRMAYGSSLFIPLTLSMFFYVFPRRTFILPKPVSLGMVAFTLLFAGICAFTPLVHEAQVVENGVYVADVFGPLYMVYVLYFVLHLVATVFLAAEKVWRAHDPIEKKKIIFAAVGCWLFVFLAVMTNVILPLFGIFIFQLEAVSFTLFIILPVFYAIVRYRFLDLQLVLQQSFTYASNVILYTLPVLGIALSFSNGRLLLWQVAILLVLCGTLSTMAWFHTLPVCNRFWSYVFYRDKKNPLQRIDEALSGFQRSLGLGLDQLSRALGVGGTQFAFAGDDRLPQLTHFFQSNPDDDLVRDELQYQLTHGTVIQGEKDILQQVKSEMDAYTIAVAIPVLDERKQLLGILLLEQKINGRLFSVQEIDEVKVMLQDATVYLVKEKEYQNLKERLKDPASLDKAFLDNLMHEIKTPLFVAQNIKELIEWKKLRPEDQEFLDESEEALQELTRKLDRIADAFQWQTGMMRLEPSYLTLEQLFGFLERDFADQNITISIKTTPVSLRQELFAMDAQQLKRAFGEIIKNAQFFNNHKTPNLDVHIERDGDQVVFTFTDNGIGMASEHWERIFELLFVIAESRNPGEAGLGVGLTRAKGIIEAHGGTIAVENSTIDEGTTLRVAIPLEGLEQ